MGRQHIPNKLVVMIAEKSDGIAGGIDSGGKVLKAISASEAFRSYNWIKNVPTTNAAGNFRGMVISARWKTVFDFTSDVGETIGNIATLAGFAASLAEASSQIESILKSNNDWATKGAMISTQVSSAAVRTVGGIMPGGTHVLALSLQGYCGMADLATRQSLTGPKQCVQKLQSMDAWVRSTFNTVTDGNNIYLWINTHCVAR
jgi:hypothetical protein